MSCLDTSSEFFQVLTAPYIPPLEPPSAHRAQPLPDHAARCRATINWTSSEPIASSSSNVPASPRPTLDQPIYKPHGPWAWTHGLPIDDPKQHLLLRKGAQCSASIDSGTVADKEIKYICRKWKMNKQKEWYGFYSELALYTSEQYLRPLQGDVVPYIIGVHIMPEAVSITMEMPHSSFWIESSPTMPNVLKERVIAAFENIHAHGVLHGDPELRHMLISPDGKVMIIDFGMSRAVREHTSLGIERAEPEEFRLEMRKVKYKLDYDGARKREGDKVDDYLCRVRRNRKISELWKRRAKGERVGPIPQYEEDPEEYELDPPVNAQDFQEDWITASDDSPIRVVVPGQTPDEVANQVQAFLCTLEAMRSAPRSESPCSSLIGGRHLQISRTSDQENVREVPLPHPLPGCSRTKGETHSRCRVNTARRVKKRPSRDVAELGGPSHKCENDLLPLTTRHIEGTSRRRDHIRHRHLRNTFISSRSSDPSTAPAFPSSIDVVENPSSLEPEECRRIQESRRQAMAQYSRAPKGILKRRREDVANPNNRLEGADRPPCKKLRFSQHPVPQSPRGRTPFSDAPSGRRPRVIVCSRVSKRPKIPNGRPQLVDFTLPSLRTLSSLVGSLMPWVGCVG